MEQLRLSLPSISHEPQSVHSQLLAVQTAAGGEGAGAGVGAGAGAGDGAGAGAGGGGSTGGAGGLLPPPPPPAANTLKDINKEVKKMMVMSNVVFLIEDGDALFT